MKASPEITQRFAKNSSGGTSTTKSLKIKLKCEGPLTGTYTPTAPPYFPKEKTDLEISKELNEALTKTIQSKDQEIASLKAQVLSRDNEIKEKNTHCITHAVRYVIE